MIFQNLKNRTGATLVELMAAVLIILIGLSAFTMAYFSSKDIVYDQKLRRKALVKARADLELFKVYVDENPRNARDLDYQYPLDFYPDGEVKIMADVIWEVGPYKSKSTMGDGFGIRELDVWVVWRTVKKRGSQELDREDDNSLRLSYDIPIRMY